MSSRYMNSHCILESNLSLTLTPFPDPINGQKFNIYPGNHSIKKRHLACQYCVRIIVADAENAPVAIFS